MSLLRLAGILTALLLVWLCARNLARRRPSPAEGFGLLAAGALLLISFVPGVMNVPTRLLSLGHTHAGRLIALLILSNLMLWVYVFWSNDRRRRSVDALTTQIESLTGLWAAQTAPTRLEGIAVVMPAYNEEESVGDVVCSLPRALDGQPLQAVVVADGCRDQTATTARAAGAIVLELPRRSGGGAAIRLGYNYAARAGASVIVTMDADGQHRADDLRTVVAPLLAGQADVVIGSRRLGQTERVSSLRTVGLRFFNLFLNLLLATRLTDCSSGFRAFAGDRLPRLETVESQYHTAETIMLVRRLGLRVAEVPITVRRRKAGESKKGSDLVYGYRFARVMLTRWLRG